MEQFKRAPRNPKYWWSYAGHFLQGLAVGVSLPGVNLILACLGYWLYQVVEYRRFADKRDAMLRWGPGFEVDDWPSRDLADHLAGLWVGTVAQITVCIGIGCVIWLL